MAMHESASVLSWTTSMCFLGGMWLVYVVGLVVQRLWFSPLAHFPGPRLAALTQCYEFYYDFVLGGQYNQKIQELHEIYGPVVRINPWEVHVADRDFYAKLHASSGPVTRPRRSASFWEKQFGTHDNNTIATVDDGLQTLRQGALNPFFSTQSVHEQQSVIEERVDALLHALIKYAKKYHGKPLNVLHPLSAFTNDVMNKYAFARSDHLLEREDFGAEVADRMLKGTQSGLLGRHTGCVSGSSRRIASEFRGSEKQRLLLDDRYSTVFHEILSPRETPFHDMDPAFLAREGEALLQGGTLLPAWAMSLAVLHLLHKPSTLARLRDELCTAMPDPNDAISLARLEDLPYLSAVIQESLRLSLGSSGRLAQVAPHNDTLTCRDSVTGKAWEVPGGVLVSTTPYGSLMDSDIFRDAESFQPERWLEGGDCLDHHLVSGGSGLQACVGMALANAEMHLSLAKLFRRWGGHGDRRPGDVGFFKVLDLQVRDCEMATEDYSLPRVPTKRSKALQVVLEAC